DGCDVGDRSCLGGSKYGDALSRGAGLRSELRIALDGTATVNNARGRSLLERFGKFGAVGAGGILVQVLVLKVLLEFMKYQPATAIAVESSVLFNFFWHRRWTWADRTELSAGRAL